MTDRHIYQREAAPATTGAVPAQLEVKNAPWTASAPDLGNQSEFPSMGASGDAPTTPMGAWGHRRR